MKVTTPLFLLCLSIQTLILVQGRPQDFLPHIKSGAPQSGELVGGWDRRESGDRHQEIQNIGRFHGYPDYQGSGQSPWHHQHYRRNEGQQTNIVYNRHKGQHGYQGYHINQWPYGRRVQQMYRGRPNVYMGQMEPCGNCRHNRNHLYQGYQRMNVGHQPLQQQFNQLLPTNASLGWWSHGQQNWANLRQHKIIDVGIFHPHGKDGSMKERNNNEEETNWQHNKIIHTDLAQKEQMKKEDNDAIKEEQEEDNDTEEENNEENNYGEPDIEDSEDDEMNDNQGNDDIYINEDVKEPSGQEREHNNEDDINFLKDEINSREEGHDNNNDEERYISSTERYNDENIKEDDTTINNSSHHGINLPFF